MWMKTVAALTGSPGWALSLARICPAGAPMPTRHCRSSSSRTPDPDGLAQHRLRDAAEFTRHLRETDRLGRAGRGANVESAMICLPATRRTSTESTARRWTPFGLSSLYLLAFRPTP
jgi:hypothetical protein